MVNEAASDVLAMAMIGTMESAVRLSNALMDIYMKCGSLEQAVALFDGMTKRTVITWTTMVAGYAKFGILDVARRVFNDMPERDTISWNALIAGAAEDHRSYYPNLQHKNQDEASWFEIFEESDELVCLQYRIQSSSFWSGSVYNPRNRSPWMRSLDGYILPLLLLSNILVWQQLLVYA